MRRLQNQFYGNEKKLKLFSIAAWRAQKQQLELAGKRVGNVYLQEILYLV